MKTATITFWVSTILIGLFIISGAFFLNQPFALEGTKHLGLPLWFHWELGILKAIGALVILLPFFGNRIKEWAYFGLFLDVCSAFYALAWVDGMKGSTFLPLIIFVLLALSYWSHHRIHKVF